MLFSTAPRRHRSVPWPTVWHVQLWTHDFLPLLDGPLGNPDDIRRAAECVCDGGLFGYRFLFPAMRVGRHEIYWHRPLVAFHPHADRPTVVDSAPPGYLTAYVDGEPDFDKPLEFWPRLLKREPYQMSAELFHDREETPPWRTLTNVAKILTTWERCGGRPLPQSFARQLLTIPKTQTLEGHAPGPTTGVGTAIQPRTSWPDQLRASPTPTEAGALRRACWWCRRHSRTSTPRRARLRVEYWNTIAELSAGQLPSTRTTRTACRTSPRRRRSRTRGAISKAWATTCSATILASSPRAA